MSTPQRRDWFDAMRTKGHMPRVDDDGFLDIWAVNAEHHNGPACEACGWNCCMHCEGIGDIPECSNAPLELEAVEVTGRLISGPVAVVEPYGIVLEPGDRSDKDAVARFLRRGGLVIREGLGDGRRED